MMNDTINPKSRGRGLFFWLMIVSLGVHIILLIQFGPMLYTRMEFNRRKEQQRAAQVKEREKQRKLAEAQRREQMQLSDQQSEQMRRDQERRQSQVLQDRLRELEDIASEMRKTRDEQLENLRHRKELDLVKMRIDKINQLTDDYKLKANEVTNHNEVRPELKDFADQKTQELDTKVDKLAQEPENYQANAQELSELVNLQLKEFENQRKVEEDGTQRYRMELIERSLDEIATVSEELAQGMSVDEYNDVDMVQQNDSDSDMAFDESEYTVAQLYQDVVDMELEIQQDFNISRAAEIAQSQGSTIEDTMGMTQNQPPERPDLSNSLDSSEQSTIADFDRFRQALDQADQVTADIRTRSMGLLAQAGGNMNTFGQAQASAAPAPPVRALPMGQRGMVIAQAARGQARRVVNMTALLSQGVGYGGDFDQNGLRIASEASGAIDPAKLLSKFIGPELHVDYNVAQQNALPGRTFTDSSQRKGWLFLDTWYVIGPWENKGQLRHDISHPPEQVIDFDAEYTDGKYAEEEDHPQQKMKWRFYQSDQIRCQPPVVYSDSTFYAYTEISSDRDREVLLTISTDDAARAWLNGQVVWEDVGLSSWNLGEGFRRVPLRRGFNTLLVRIENGPAHCVWSVLMCPIELMDK